MSIATAGRPYLALLLMLSLPAMAAALSIDAKVVDADICSLVAYPKRFNKKIVRVRAQVISSIHGAGLFDDSCKERAVALWRAEATLENPDQKAYDTAIAAPPGVGTIGKQITATFIGQFLWHPRGHPRRVLICQKVEDLKVELTKSEESH